jgi:hypothetical protein
MAHLVVVEGDTKNVGEEKKDFVLRVVRRWSTDIALDAADGLDLP